MRQEFKISQPQRVAGSACVQYEEKDKFEDKILV